MAVSWRELLTCADCANYSCEIFKDFWCKRDGNASNSSLSGEAGTGSSSRKQISGRIAGEGLIKLGKKRKTIKLLKQRS